MGFNGAFLPYAEPSPLTQAMMRNIAGRLSS